MVMERGCGWRVRGGAYAELGLSRFGMPLESFIKCPPIPLDVDRIGLSPINTRMIERDGAWHILDWVGASGYPNPTDDLEEIRRLGMSAKLELQTAGEYAKLTFRSRILRVHPFAHIVDRRAYWQERQGMNGMGYSWEYCPCRIHGHGPEFLDKYKAVMAEDGSFQPPMCVGMLYEDIAQGHKAEGSTNPREVLRLMPSFEYKGYSRPEEAPDGENYRPAIYASFPIQRIVVIRDNQGGKHRAKIEKLKDCKLFDKDSGVVEE